MGDDALHFFHAGTTTELRWIIESFSEAYDTVGLAGFSLGGIVVLKCLGEEGDAVKPNVVGAVSVPIDLRACSHRLSESPNRVYLDYFMCSLRECWSDRRAFCCRAASRCPAWIG